MGNDERQSVLVSFSPTAIPGGVLPISTPVGIRREFEEAEACASAGAFRGASALLRSALEKTLAVNGYVERNLYLKIDAAAADGVITAARRQRAHDNVRSLGNDVVHEEWRPVDHDEFAAAHVYVQRVIEDFYENREEVEIVLRARGRLVGEVDRSVEEEID